MPNTLRVRESLVLLFAWARARHSSAAKTLYSTPWMAFLATVSMLSLGWVGRSEREEPMKISPIQKKTGNHLWRVEREKKQGLLIFAKWRYN